MTVTLLGKPYEKIENEMNCLLSVDEEPPTVIDCSGPNSTIYSSDTQTYVDWRTPVFTDNSGLSVNITSDSKPGYFRIGKFSLSQQKFSYRASRNFFWYQGYI